MNNPLQIFPVGSWVFIEAAFFPVIPVEQEVKGK